MNNLIKNKITIIIPNRDSKYLDIVIGNFKEKYKDIIYQIIVINQEDSEPFMKGQLYNIAFKFVKSEYILLIDNNIINTSKINLIKTYQKINHPYIGYNSISEFILNQDNSFSKIHEFQTNNFGGFIFMKYNDFLNCSGFSNLCFLYDDYNIINYKINNFKRLNNNIGHIKSPIERYGSKSKENNYKVFQLYQNKKIFYEDGYQQTLYNIIYDKYTKDNIRYIGVNNIRVPKNYKYLDLYNKNLSDAHEDLNYINKEDIGVSICITAYKSNETIKETLDSVIRQTWFQTHDNWEILLGIDGCYKTLGFVKQIMNNYKNLRVFMMDSNEGTYVTSNTLMKISKYENLIRFDSDDIMCSNMVETLMKNANEYDIQRFRFAYLSSKLKTTMNTFGQHFIKKSVFEKFGGYRNWKCAADYDFIIRTNNFVKSKKLNDKYLFYYRTNNNSLTHSEETGMKSEYRKKLHEFIYSQDYSKEDNAKIECITNTYKEIFSNIHEYNQEDYMYIMTIQNNWADLC